MVLNTLNTLISDIMLTVRNSNISESESINRLQIEQWIHQYRATLIKQDIDKNRDINPQYIQHLPGLNVSVINNVVNGIPVNKKRYKISTTLPKLIDFNNKHGIVYITDPFDNIIQLVSKNRSEFQKYRKYTATDYIAYIDNGNQLFLVGNGDLKYINLGVIAEDPSTIPGFKSTDIYPIPASMIPILRQMILTKELNIMTHEVTDKTNNATDDTQNAQTESNK